MTKGKFLTYEDIRAEGITNMFHVSRVVKLSTDYPTRLTEEDCLDIMDNYSSYREKWLGD